MNFETFLVHLLVVLVAARIAAEIAERIGQPAVLLEILAGMIIGPSLLGWVGHDETLKIIAELGAILLLFEVGINMDLRELSRVGGDCLRVALIGIVAPFVMGFVAATALGIQQGPALFLAGAVTATSVGITARVFGDLRALATSEARTVLGAAVADDVGGLLILTVVAGIVTGGGFTAGELATMLGLALGFLLVVGGFAIWAGPRLFGWISQVSRTEGTAMVLALAFALLLARTSAAVRLAPIVGAFVAGLALSASPGRDDLQRRLVPIVHLIVPVFFLLIGVETTLSVFTEPSVLVMAAALTAVAVVGKLISGAGVRKGRADRILVGVAMIPRGEVGLIFAGIGLTAGVLDSKLYAVLVAVVMFTTFIAPPWLKGRIVKTRRRPAEIHSAAIEPQGGWLKIDDDEVDLVAEPPDLLAPVIGLETALACASRSPGPWLMQWLSSADAGAPDWSPAARQRLFRLLRGGNERSWRFLEVTGFLEAYLPVLAEAVSQRKRDPFNLDPAGSLHFNTLEQLQQLIAAGKDPALMVWERLPAKEPVLLAALAESAFEALPDAAARTAELARFIGMDPRSASLAAFIVEESQLLPAASRRLDITGEDFILELASHVETSEKADALYVLAVAADAMQTWQRERLDELFELLQAALSRVPGTGGADFGPVEVRRQEIIEALPHLDRKEVQDHLEAAPRRYLVAHGPDIVARHLKMTQTPLGRDEVRIEAEPTGEPGEWLVHVATRDRRGLLAAIAGVFASRQIPVLEAFISTWRDGGAIDVFRVKAQSQTSWQDIGNLIRHKLVHQSANGKPAGIEGIVEIDNVASPWHTIVEVRADDREGLLYRVASALSRAGLDIHMAVVNTSGEVAVDIFYVTGKNGGKLDEAGETDLRLALAGRPLRRWAMVIGRRRGRIKAGI